jgi:hypothetical protein
MIKIIFGFVLACCLWVIFLFTIKIPEYIIYDCRIAEISPDIPPKAKEQCRNMNMKPLT